MVQLQKILPKEFKASRVEEKLYRNIEKLVSNMIFIFFSYSKVILPLDQGVKNVTAREFQNISRKEKKQPLEDTTHYTTPL